MRSFLFYVFLMGTVLLVSACHSKTVLVEKSNFMDPQDKLDFDIDALDKDGLIGTASGKVSVDYEFCIPKGEEFEKQVLAIDPEIKIYTQSMGRSGCGKTQSLVIGNTHKVGHRKILIAFSSLDFVKQIKRVWWE